MIRPVLAPQARSDLVRRHLSEVAFGPSEFYSEPFIKNMENGYSSLSTVFYLLAALPHCTFATFGYDSPEHVRRQYGFHAREPVVGTTKA